MTVAVPVGSSNISGHVIERARSTSGDAPYQQLISLCL
jgi:hypothetical protein